MIKTMQFNGTNADLPSIISQLELSGFFVLDVRYSKWMNENGEETGDRIDIEVETIQPQNKKYFVPIETLALYADDVFVSSRDIKDDPDEAFTEALDETKKSKGQPKSLDLISRSTLKALEKARNEIKDLEATVKDLEKRLKKLEKQ